MIILNNKNQMWSFFKVNGAKLIELYIDGLLRVPNRDVTDFFTDVIC
jgi:hypothetical protein